MAGGEDLFDHLRSEVFLFHSPDPAGWWFASPAEAPKKR
jgi:hypothetical protein